MKPKLISFNVVLQAINSSLVPVSLKVHHQDKWSDWIDLTEKPIRETLALLDGLGRQDLIFRFGTTELKSYKPNATFFQFERERLNPNLT